MSMVILYEKIKNRCEQTGISFTALCSGTRINKSVFTRMRRGTLKDFPDEYMKRVCYYLCVPDGYFDD